MIDKLMAVEARYDQLMTEMGDPAVQADTAKFRAHSKALAERHGEFEPYGSSVSCAVNEDYSRMTATLRDGDEVAFLPPVSGGAAQDHDR